MRMLQKNLKKIWFGLPLLLVMPITVLSQKENNGTKQGAQPEIKDSSKTVPALYRNLSEKNRIHSSATTNGRELEKVPVFNLNNALYGRLAGLSVGQFSGDPGDDAASLSLRGMPPIVLVDGIPRSITNVNPEQIESITVLKDALATSLLGIRSNGGAILITTRKGDGMGHKLSFTANTGWQTPLKGPKPLNAFDYATLYNEALANDGRPLAYTPAQLDAYKNHSDQFLYPDVNWKQALLKSPARFNRYNLTVGDSRSSYRYFLSLDYLNQQGLFVQSNVNDYSTNSGYKRYNIRGNVEVDINKYLTASLNIFGRIQDEIEPGSIGSAALYNNILNTPANAYPVLNPNGSLGGSQTFQTNVYGQLLNSGYQQLFARDGGVDLSIKRKLDDVLPGLWVKGLLSFNGTLVQNTNRSRSIEVFNMKIGTLNDTTYQRYGTRADQLNSSSTDNWSQQMYAEASAGYSKKIKKSSIDVLLLANTQNYRNNAVELPYIFKALNASLAYNYDEKYFLELAANYSGNNRFPVGNQAGIFPAFGLGWNVANENFFKNAIPFIQILKLRGNYGKTGGANPGYYAFNQYYEAATGYNIGGSASGVSGITQADIANPGITWEKGNKFNIGADIGFWKNKASISIDYFNYKMYDLLRQRGTASAIFGADYPAENIGENKLTGWEFNGNLSHDIGAVKLSLNLNLATLKNTLQYYDEPNRPYEWMMRTGRRSGQIFGLVADGFFKDAQDIINSPKIDGFAVVPGDIKYKDLNGDGIINVLDETALRTEKPELNYGAAFSASYKAFELTVVMNGVKNRDLLIAGTGQYEFQAFGNGNGQAFEHHLNRWTPATAATANYPRLTVGLNQNNHRTSSFWVKPGDYFRLRNVQLAYTLSNKLLSRAKISGLRFFVSGVNLLTSSKLTNTDPEVTSGYPNSRTLSIGATIKL